MKTTSPLTVGLAFAAFLAAPGAARADSGEYEVPTTPALRDYSHLPLPALDWHDDGQNLTLTYDLPVALVGPQVVHVALTGRHVDGAFMSLQGDAGNASCQETSYGATCLVRLTGFVVDKEARTTFLQATCTTPAELAARLAVADRFDAEPIGLVTYFEGDGPR